MSVRWILEFPDVVMSHVGNHVTVDQISVLEPASFIRRMVSAVNVTTASRESDKVRLLFMGASKECHSQVSTETLA